MRSSAQQRIVLDGNSVEYDVVVSKSARRTRVRVGPGGVEVIQPASVSDQDVSMFLRRNEKWVLSQLDRLSSLRALRRPPQPQLGELLYRGASTQVRIEFVETQARCNLVRWSDGEILVRRGPKTQTPAARGLENWLRRQARAAIDEFLPTRGVTCTAAAGANLRDGPANEVGKLLVAKKPIIQLASHPRTRLCAPLPHRARGRASGCTRPLVQVLACYAEHLSGNGASKTVVE